MKTGQIGDYIIMTSLHDALIELAKPLVLEQARNAVDSIGIEDRRIQMYCGEIPIFDESIGVYVSTPAIIWRNLISCPEDMRNLGVFEV